MPTIGPAFEPLPDDPAERAEVVQLESELQDLHLITAKPVLFVANVDEGDEEVPEAVAEHAAAAGRRRGGGLLPPGGRAVRARRRGRGGDARGPRGVGESGLDRVVRGAFELLRLNAFFTAGEGKPAQSWHLRRGLTAWHAAGRDPLRHPEGFVRAEVIGWDALRRGGRLRRRPATRATLRAGGPRLRDARRRRDHGQVHAVRCDVAGRHLVASRPSLGQRLSPVRRIERRPPRPWAREPGGSRWMGEPRPRDGRGRGRRAAPRAAGGRRRRPRPDRRGSSPTRPAWRRCCAAGGWRAPAAPRSRSSSSRAAPVDQAARITRISAVLGLTDA